MVSSHLSKSIISYGNINFDLRHFDFCPFFSGMQLGRKTVLSVNTGTA
jgi:hypothetical protein